MVTSSFTGHCSSGVGVKSAVSASSLSASLENRKTFPSFIKYGHTKEKLRFFCHGCRQTFLYSTGTLAYHSHFSRSIWADFIRDTLDGKTLDDSAEELGFSHQTAFNMRHKVLMAFQNMLEKEPVILSGVAELDETFVPDCYKGKRLPVEVSRDARKHGAKAAKRGISSEYVAICTGIQRDGKAVAETVNRAKPSGKELCGIFGTHIAEDTLILTDGLRSYKSLEAATGCTVVNVNTEKGKKVFNLNVVNSLHSYTADRQDLQWCPRESTWLAVCSRVALQI